MTQTYFPARPLVDEWMPDVGQHIRQIARVLNETQRGHINIGFMTTLTPSATTTVITDARISLQTAVHLSPLTASAAVAYPSIYTVPEAGLATIHHPSAVAADQNFMTTIVG